MFAPGTGSVVLLGVVLLLAVVALASPAGRRAASAAIGSVGRWPGLIRSELRGDAPLGAAHRDGPAAPDETTPDIPAAVDTTTPDIPAVRDRPAPTRVFPQVERHRR